MSRSNLKTMTREVTSSGIHQFLSKFFRTNMMNHCEFLKQLNHFGSSSDDCYLIAEVCERLVDQTQGKRAASIEPFYGGTNVDGSSNNDDAVQAIDLGHITRDDFSKHTSFPRNCFNIMMVYASLRETAGRTRVQYLRTRVPQLPHQISVSLGDCHYCHSVSPLAHCGAIQFMRIHFGDGTAG